MKLWRQQQEDKREERKRKAAQIEIENIDKSQKVTEGYDNTSGAPVETVMTTEGNLMTERNLITEGDDVETPQTALKFKNSAKPLTEKERLQEDFTKIAEREHSEVINMDV